MGKINDDFLGTYKLKHTLYPTYDECLSADKDEWDRESGDRILKKGFVFNVVSVEEYCRIQNYDENDTEDFMEKFCDFDYVAYMKSNDNRFILINSLEDFEVVNNG